MWMLPGRNAVQSLRNLQEWLDAVAVSTYLGSVATNKQGQRLESQYHRMKGYEADGFVGELSTQLNEWEWNAKRRG